jgi:hypothetical protein
MNEQEIVSYGAMTGVSNINLGHVGKEALSICRDEQNI